jgi:ABC-type antimicrobial peptide transport system permease subunit
MTLAIRTSRAGTESLIREISGAIRSVNPDVPLAKVRTLNDLYRASTARTSFALVLLAIAGFMALTLAIVGVYGVLSYAVAQRRKELSIRIALGAAPAAVRAVFIRRGLTLACAGGALGLSAAVVFSRWMSSLLFGIAPLDPLTYGTCAATILTAAIVASYIPARRAAAVDPMDTLRTE